MSYIREEKTIAAISTPFGRGGIAVIRISGKDAIKIASKMFKVKGSRSLFDVMGGTALYGDILYDNERIDDGIATVFRAPHSFTGEDTVEISCHGGILLTEKVLESALNCGAVMADAGEFSKRAFLNGKIGLTEAEAIINLINAEGEEQLKVAASHTDGRLSREIDEIVAELISYTAETYVDIDYPDEDLSNMTSEKLLTKLNSVKVRIDNLLSTYRAGRAISEGIPTAIVGKPNTGKSSVLNMLMQTERAIVSDIAGTTRDTIEESVQVGKIILRIADTAGIRNASDEIEKIGIKRTYEKIDNAELVLAVFDGSKECDEHDKEIIEYLKGKSAVKIAIINKNDLTKKFDESVLVGFDRVVSLNTFEKAEREKLCDIIEKMYVAGEINYNKTAVLTSKRQASAVKKASLDIGRAIDALKSGVLPDICALDIEEAIKNLSEVDGRAVSEKVVAEIFSKFCVGK